MKKLVVLGLCVFAFYTFGCNKHVVTESCPDGKCCPVKKDSDKCNCGECGCGVIKGMDCNKPKCRHNGMSVSDTISGPELEGKQISCDLPQEEHLRNKGGSDGAGLCVFTSIDHSARWQNEENLIGFRDFMTKFPGGGYPEKVDLMIKKKSQNPVDYIQSTDGDVKVLELALKTNRMPCITYGYSPRYGHNIAHMVNLVYLDEKYACILDNNFPDTYEWVERSEFIRRWNLGGSGWAVVLLNAPPPPSPHN